jgi:hypothetical protein
MKSKKPLTLLLFLALLLSLAFVGCGRISQQEDTAPEVSMALSVEPEPLAVGPSHLIITLTDANGNPVDGAKLQIKGDMSHAGMVPVLAEVEGSSAGRYEAPFEWTMGGDWIVSVTAQLPDGRTTVRRFDFTVGGDMGQMDMDDEMEMEGMETQQ